MPAAPGDGCPLRGLDWLTLQSRGSAPVLLAEELRVRPKPAAAGARQDRYFLTDAVQPASAGSAAGPVTSAAGQSQQQQQSEELVSSKVANTTDTGGGGAAAASNCALPSATPAAAIHQTLVLLGFDAPGHTVEQRAAALAEVRQRQRFFHERCLLLPFVGRLCSWGSMRQATRPNSELQR